MISTKRLILLLCLAFLLMTGIISQARTLPTLRDGDIIFHTSRSAQSLAVQQATGSRYSHMGIILLRDGRPYVFEAAATVKYTPLTDWIARGEQRHFVVKRLKNADSLLTPAALASLREQARRFAGKPYDSLFSWSDDRLYCSELVWKIYQRALGIEIGERQKVRDFRLNAPAVKQKLQERYGTQIPWDDTVISPKAMFESPLLVTLTNH